MSASLVHSSPEPALPEPPGSQRTPTERALEALRKKGNPFRQQFARNSDDAVCSLYHVDELFARERGILVELVESYRGKPSQPTAVLPLLGARGAGKTHLLHWLKHGPSLGSRLFVTPGTFRIDASGSDSSFLEYLLYQCINVLLAGAEQGGIRPLAAIGEHLTRGVLRHAVRQWTDHERLNLFPSNGIQRLGWRLGVGVPALVTSIEDFSHDLKTREESCRSLALSRKLDLPRLTSALTRFVEEHQPRDLKGELRKRLMCGFIRATLLEEESQLADFLTDGFTDVGFAVTPSREQLTLSLLVALTEVIVGAGIPVAVAFDQLEELLYGQTADEIRRSSDAFFGGIVQLMSQVPGLCILLFVEEGLWNRIVPPLPPHILDRLHEPLQLPDHGLIRGVRLSTPTKEELTEVVACRVRRTLASFAGHEALPPSFPFGDKFLAELARKETVLRLMLQGCCSRLDDIFAAPIEEWRSVNRPADTLDPSTPAPTSIAESAVSEKKLDIAAGRESLEERWHHEVRAAERKLKPVGSLAGATAEIQGALARWLHLCKSLGVEQGKWRMVGIQDQVQVGAHPSYGALLVVEWSDGTKVARVGIGMWLGRGVGKPRDLETKLAVFALRPPLVDHLILLRPSDDVRLSGKTQEAWDAALAAGHPFSLEPVDLETFARLYAFPRWMQGVSDSYPDGRIPAPIYQFLAEETGSILQMLALPEVSPGRAAA